ncbi:hypothetical protein GM418_11430 [Maribellus comscasis]|uniref:Carboxypeptidase-like regulatory domain-containing protein n=1 Tax=Maribellus comscasis TaxID=2681766 RepID=A0A6I6JMV5_9BACT|nr:carboxypeptidase-like regulatory domain-containing protein [Maribellus comscasis]QGY44245.1 hypothetical protein GM418_11430 [Maribellus comscasis]
MLKVKVSILLAILFSSSIYGQQDGSVLEKRVTIVQNNQTLSNILNQLSWQAGVFFSYDASVIDAEKKYNIEAADKSLFTVLSELFGTKKFRFSERENQIIISENTDYKQPEEKQDSIPVKYFFLSGKIIEDKKEEPIPYASVSLLNKPIGTITNIDGEFLLKVHPGNIKDTVIISCMGYEQIELPAFELLDEDLFIMNPVSIRIREVKVTAITPDKLLKNIRNNISKNYSDNNRLMTAFYRETIKQDKNYVNISEAIVEILKASYINLFRDDLVRLLKGRRSPDVQPFQWLNFKLQGGPFTITKLDVIKNMESFIDGEFEHLYKYNIKKVVWYNDYPVYVLEFKPTSNQIFPLFVGEMYVHRETFAVLHARFQLNKEGLKTAESVMIKKKPRRVKAKPTDVKYEVNYQQYSGKWHLANAKASVKIKVKSKRDNVNSEYHSVSDLLVTDINKTEVKRFTRNESINQSDIFVELINEYDEKFWENYNIIKPDENLINAIKTITSNN